MTQLSDQTNKGNGILFSSIIYVVLDYKNAKYEPDPLRLSFFHHLTLEGTENKKTTIGLDFDHTNLKRCVILYPFEQKKDRGVGLTRSGNIAIFVNLVLIFQKKSNYVVVPPDL